jgi:hypothetical protein
MRLQVRAFNQRACVASPTDLASLDQISGIATSWSVGASVATTTWSNASGPSSTTWTDEPKSGLWGEN